VGESAARDGPLVAGLSGIAEGMSWFRTLSTLLRRSPGGPRMSCRPAGTDVAAASLRVPSAEVSVIILGIILILLGLIVSSLHWLLIIGVILLIVGLVLNFVPIGGTRRRYY
jgi:hypothetical protein